MEQTDTQQLYNGFGNTLARAFELVATPALFGLIGYGIDRAAGLLPVFTVTLTIFCLIGMSVRMYYGYVTAMQAHEANGPWAKKRAVPAEREPGGAVNTAADTEVYGPAVERQVAADMIKRGLPVAPVLMLISGLIWGVDGVASSAFGVALVLINFALAAAIMAWAARISLVVLMASVMFGYIARLALITTAVLIVHNQSWVAIVPLGLTIIVTHLGLLLWETKYVSASLAFPGLKPSKKGS